MKVLIVLLSALLLPAQSDPGPFAARISVRIDSENDDTRTQFTSYLSRELRNLDNVVITGEKPTYILRLNVMELESKGGTAGGFAASALLTRPLDVAVVKAVMQDKVEPRWADKVTGYLANAETVLQSLLVSGAHADIEVVAKYLATTLDGKQFEPDRRRHHTLREISSAK
jgi:hypothetical protein